MAPVRIFQTSSKLCPWLTDKTKLKMRNHRRFYLKIKVKKLGHQKDKKRFVSKGKCWKTATMTLVRFGRIFWVG